METIELTKTFRFEAAHRLAKGYKGKCANIHGHSWNGSITVICEKLDDYGMGVDYSKLKEITKFIEDVFDHSIIIFHGDKDLIEFCQRQKYSFVQMPENPTSEAIAKQIWHIAETKLPKNCILKEITVDETCTTSCKYIGLPKV